MCSDNIAIRIQGISKCFQIYDSPRDRIKQFIVPQLQRVLGKKPKQYFREFWALKDISLEIKKGETIGIIGRNGSGKSTLLQIICGTLTPSSGNVEIFGRVAALLELGSGFNPEFTGRENIYMNAAILGLSKQDVNECYDDITEFADIGEFIDQPVKNYSSGMVVRLAFSVAIHVKPDILIVDEALSVGDAYFQAKCATMIRKIINTGTTVLFVSHDIASVKSLCKYAMLLDFGHNKFMGDVNITTEKYYSALIAQQKTESVRDSPKNNKKMNWSKQTDDAMVFNSISKFQRIQNGAAEFLNVLMLDDQGQAIESITFGNKVTLRQVIKINAPIPKLNLAYHIRDKNGLDIIYSDTKMESKNQIISANAGSIYVVDWSFIAYLREDNYVVSSMASEQVNPLTEDVIVVDFIPISVRFSISKGQNPAIYATVYWENDLKIQEFKNDTQYQ